MSCGCSSNARVHFAGHSDQKGICGRRYALGCWTNEARIIRDPYVGRGFIGDFCKFCEKWLKANRPDILETWDMALDLKRKQFAKLKELPRERVP